MARVVVIASAGVGGDLPPLMAVTLGLKERGHELTLIGDAASARLARNEGLDALTMDSRHDLGPLMGRAIRESLALPPAAQGGFLRERLATWSSEAAASIEKNVAGLHPDLLLTSLFGSAAARFVSASSSAPFGVVNSTFYVGPDPPRPLAEDLRPRAAELIRYLVNELEHASLVLHATDQHFDYDHTGLPPGHHYVGPLFWEEDVATPAYLDEPGDAWVLVTISSQAQDDVQLAQQALLALAGHHVRVVLTLGPDHRADELETIPANARVEQYVSHAEVLERGALLVSHAGHGSVMKALWYGVPMVLIPWARDQPGVAARAKRLGAAVVVERDQLRAETLSGAIVEAFNGPYREAARQISRRLQETDPVAAACGHIERLLDTANAPLSPNTSV